MENFGKIGGNGEKCCMLLCNPLGQQHIVEKIPVCLEKNRVYLERTVQVLIQGLPGTSTPPISDKKYILGTVVAARS